MKQEKRFYWFPFLIGCPPFRARRFCLANSLKSGAFTPRGILDTQLVTNNERSIIIIKNILSLLDEIWVGWFQLSEIQILTELFMGQQAVLTFQCLSVTYKMLLYHVPCYFGVVSEISLCWLSLILFACDWNITQLIGIHFCIYSTRWTDWPSNALLYMSKCVLTRSWGGNMLLPNSEYFLYSS